MNTVCTMMYGHTRVDITLQPRTYDVRWSIATTSYQCVGGCFAANHATEDDMCCVTTHCYMYFMLLLTATCMSCYYSLLHVCHVTTHCYTYVMLLLTHTRMSCCYSLTHVCHVTTHSYMYVLSLLTSMTSYWFMFKSQ